MMSYWVLFIGIAVVSWLVQMNLQNKFKKYSKIPTGNGMTGRDVALKMLHDNGVTFIHPFTQIHCFVSRIVVVGQSSRSMCYLYIINSIVMQHLQSHVASCHAIAGRDLGVLLEFVLQIHLHQPTYYGNSNK